MKKLRQVQKKTDKNKKKGSVNTKVKSNLKDDELSIFDDIDVMGISEEKKREKLYNKKCDLIRKLYYRSK
jgi:hypothetical protein